MTIHPDHADRKPPLSRARLLGSNPPAPLTSEEVVRLQRAAGVSCAESLDMIEEMGLTQLKTVLAYFAYEQIFDDVTIGAERVAGLVGCSASWMAEKRAKIPDEHLRYEDESWHTGFSAQMPSEASDDGGLLDPAEAPMRYPAVPWRFTPPLLGPANDVVHVLCTFTPYEDSSVTHKTASAESARTRDDSPDRAGDETSHQEPRDSGEDHREKVPRNHMGSLMGHDVFQGRSEVAEYLIWDHPLLLEHEAQFINPQDHEHFTDDDPRPLEMDLDDARPWLEERLCLAAAHQAEHPDDDAWELWQQLAPGVQAWWREREGAKRREAARDFRQRQAQERQESEDALREIAQHFRETVQDELEVWLGEQPTVEEMRELYSRLLRRWVAADKRGEEPALEHLEDIWKEAV